MKWIFNKRNMVTREDNNSMSVTFEQKSNFGGERGDGVLFLEKQKEDWVFTARYRIADIDIQGLDEEYKVFTISLELVEIFKEVRRLEDFAYSLKRIKNYASPIKHFSRKYGRLEEAEFEAIVENKIYLKRTLLGTVLNAMHTDHQKAYIGYLSVKAPEILPGRTDIDTALEMLKEYLDYAIIQPAKYLTASSKILKKILSEEELEQVGFAEDIENVSPKNSQMIKPQVALISEYLEYLDISQYEESETPEMKYGIDGFRKLFKDSPLPITIK